VVSDEQTFEAQDRSVDTVFIRPSYEFNPYISLGMSASYSWIRYSDETGNDGTTYLIGPFVQIRINDLTDLYLEIGYQGSNFDEANTPRQVLTSVDGQAFLTPATDDDSEASVYFKAELSNRPSVDFRHKLILSRTQEVGVGSNFYDLTHVEYAADWLFAENMTLNPSVFYEYFETSGEPSEKAHRAGASVGVRRIFSNSLSVGLDYRFLYKDSNQPDSDYYQNLGYLSLYYKF
jgi:hypothetical protein